MSGNKLRMGAISAYIVFVLIISGLIGFFIFEKIINIDNVTAKNIIIVDCNGNGNYTTIQDAINNASNGDIIYVWAGVYYENLIVNKTVTLIGNGTKNTIINGSGIGDVVYISANFVSISGFTITGSGNKFITPFTDLDAGIELRNVNNVTIKNNNCSNNDFGIYSYNSTSNSIKNNICNNNSRVGIHFYISNTNIIKNNSCNFNKWVGINLYISNSNTVIDNYCSYNGNVGIHLDILCNKNFIINNTITKNTDGFKLFTSNNNTFYRNTISYNNQSGFSLQYGSKDNYFYYNNFISNKANYYDAAIVEGYAFYNYYNNSNQEGNYWSEYTGNDTGAMIYSWDITDKHLIKGDAIGDTKLPFLKLDYYPFINPLGWLKPGIPILSDPGEVDTDGNYTLLWNVTARITGYILQEDNNSNFNSPTELYNGSELSFNISNRKNDTYYYRVKAYNEKYQSVWSNIVDITVDWPPNIPENLQVSTYPPGNTLNISWDLNTVDTDHYDLEFKNETMVDWEQIEPITHPGFTYNHTGLNDGETYQYRIMARDHRGQLSNYSVIVSGIPWDSVPPKPPNGLEVISTTHNSTTLIWDPNIEPDLEGYNLFKSEKSDPNKWGEPIDTIEKNNEEYIDTGLDEETTYYYVITAFDEVPNESGFSNLAQGITTLGQHWPVINNSIKDFEIPEDTIDNSINLYHWFKDINNDPLVFQCEGQAHLNVTIHQNNGTVTLIPEKNWNGKETLIFYANDSVFNVSDNVTITVTPVNDAPGPAVIIEPKDRVEVENGTEINFSAICDDPDLIYVDRLTFKWYSNISGKFGEGKNLTYILLPSGQHQIRLEVSDIAGEISIANVKITIIPTPNFDFTLTIVPDLVEIKPGEQISITAIVTNLGDVDDMIVLKPLDQAVQGINASINGPKIRNIIPNGTAEFNITISAMKDVKKGEIQLTIVAASGNAAMHKFILEKKVTLTIKITEDKETSTTDTISENIWFYIFLVIIIIVILICIFMLIVTRKKRAKQRPLPTVEAEIEESGVATTSEIVQEQIQAASSSEQLPVSATSDGSKQSILSPVVKKQEPEQISVPVAKQVPRLPPGQVETTEESLTKDEEKPSLVEQTITSSGSEQEQNTPNQEQHTAQETSSFD